MKQYQRAIEFYDKALSLQQSSIFFLNKGILKKTIIILAEALLALGKKKEAKKFYYNALNAGSANEFYIKV